MQKFARIMRGTQGAIMIASALQIILGFSGLWRVVVRLVHLRILKKIPSSFHSQCALSDVKQCFFLKFTCMD